MSFDKFAWLKQVMQDENLTAQEARLAGIICVQFTRKNGAGWAVEPRQLSEAIGGYSDIRRLNPALRKLCELGYIEEVARRNAGPGLAAQRTYNLCEMVGHDVRTGGHNVQHQDTNTHSTGHDVLQVVTSCPASDDIVSYLNRPDQGKDTPTGTYTGTYTGNREGTDSSSLSPEKIIENVIPAGTGYNTKLLANIAGKRMREDTSVTEEIVMAAAQRWLKECNRENEEFKLGGFITDAISDSPSAVIAQCRRTLDFAPLRQFGYWYNEHEREYPQSVLATRGTTATDVSEAFRVDKLAWLDEVAARL